MNLLVQEITFKVPGTDQAALFRVAESRSGAVLLPADHFRKRVPVLLPSDISV